MKLISLVFSFRNEEKNLSTLVERIESSLSSLNNWNYELIFVNDASDDNSEQILENLQKKYPITIINMSRKFGNVPCVIAGFKHANGDVIIYMDSDLQDPPEVIPNLLEEYDNGADVVHTIRTKREGENKIKLFITKIAYKIINYLADIPLPIEAGDFKLISKKALNKILDQNEFRPYVRGLSVWVGYKQAYVKYERKARPEGETKHPLFSGGPISEFINGVTSYSLKPLYIGVFFGFISLLFSVALVIYALFAKFNGLAIPGSTGIILAISFFSGILLLSIGIIGIYLARIFEQTKGRAQYVIKSIIKNN